MYRLALLFTVFFALNATAKINNDSYYLNIDSIDANCEEHELEKIVFAKFPRGKCGVKSMKLRFLQTSYLEVEMRYGADIW